MNITIYHNPRCSKSRATLELIEQKGMKPHIVEYLKTPPSEKELNNILKLLGMKPRELLRTCEPEYKEQQADNMSLTDKQLIELMVKFPKLMERPIVVTDKKACIGRPPENVINIL